MAYDGKVMREALQRFEEDKQRRASQTEARRQRIYREIPRLEAIEKELRGTVARIMTEALRHGEDPAPALMRIRTENAMLQQERAELLAEHGYAPDALEDKPRCALCGDSLSAEMTRRHNDANMLALGAGITGPNLAKRIVETFLNTEFEGGRHARRVGLLDAIEP